MDRTSVDGADSAEDSGSSQPYPSTLPGIPKVQCPLLIPCILVLYSCLLQYMFFLFNIGKRQTAVSTFAGANGRRNPQISL